MNLHHVALLRKNAEFRSAFFAADQVTADGWPVVLTMKLAGMQAQRVTGADFVEHLVRSVETRGLRIGLLGATESAGDAFALLLAKQGAELVFREHGHRNDWQLDNLSARIAAYQTDLLLVAVSPPWGDVLASEIAARDDRACVVAVGGAIDMVVGNKRRAPDAIARFGLEWLFRAAQDPKHLFRRYVVECGGTLVTYLLPLWLRLIVASSSGTTPTEFDNQSAARKEQRK
ncbi:WecB/TagA/CpsF family glycosyltransferase [Rhodococcus sp. WWJCD1]|uniref:WecB/TagA/CpsF family glycosyltransferase n=1 Tax=Rhodococcus sp. WWJCD1 TaxID=2022519 RepID=UPI0015963203|nr:WecB/TagA/CpsF family glycosyltransferase [Rhodococcus sp. WWJCD1]